MTGSDRQSAIEGCFGSSAYCRLYARECVGYYSHTIGEAGDPAVVILVPGERSWVAVTMGRTGARGAGRGFRSGARGAGHRSAPRVRPYQPCLWLPSLRCSSGAHARQIRCGRCRDRAQFTDTVNWVPNTSRSSAISAMDSAESLPLPTRASPKEQNHPETHKHSKLGTCKLLGLDSEQFRFCPLIPSPAIVPLIAEQ